MSEFGGLLKYEKTRHALYWQKNKINVLLYSKCKLPAGVKVSAMWRLELIWKYWYKCAHQYSNYFYYYCYYFTYPVCFVNQVTVVSCQFTFLYIVIIITMTFWRDFSYRKEPTVSLNCNFFWITFLSQCNAQTIQAAFPGESEHAQYVATQLFVLTVCSVSVFPHHRLWGLLYYDRWLWDL